MKRYAIWCAYFHLHATSYQFNPIERILTLLTSGILGYKADGPRTSGLSVWYVLYDRSHSTLAGCCLRGFEDPVHFRDNVKQLIRS